MFLEEAAVAHQHQQHDNTYNRKQKIETEIEWESKHLTCQYRTRKSFKITNFPSDTKTMWKLCFDSHKLCRNSNREIYLYSHSHSTVYWIPRQTLGKILTKKIYINSAHKSGRTGSFTNAKNVCKKFNRSDFFRCCCLCFGKKERKKV